MSPVENVHEPLRTQTIDPKAQPERKPEDVIAIENEVKKARARRELVQEMKLTDNLENPPPQEPPFKVSGGINLGNIDIQEQQRQMREETKAEQIRSQERIEKAERAAAEAKDALNAANLAHMQANLGSQIEALKNAIVAGNRGDIASEIDKIESVASKLGLQRGGSSGGSDLKAMIELKRLEQELKREDRRFALDMKKDERMWQLELKKLDQQARESDARLEAEKNKMAMIAAIPEQLGATIAKGLIARGDTITAPAPAPGPVRRAPATKNQMRFIEAGEGESGEIACPVCGAPVGVVAETLTTQCGSCHQPFTIKRIPIEGSEPVQEPLAP